MKSNLTLKRVGGGGRLNLTDWVCSRPPPRSPPSQLLPDSGCLVGCCCPDGAPPDDGVILDVDSLGFSFQALSSTLLWLSRSLPPVLGSTAPQNLT